MSIWILEPRDPLIARDGKPFGVGVRAATLPFPFPSTTTGAARTRAGLENGIFDPARKINGQKLLPEAVKGLEVRGPLLVELNDSDEIARWLVPAPMDVVLYRTQQEEEIIQRLQRLLPLKAEQGLTNLNQTPHATDELALVGPVKRISGKPCDEKETPRFWYWDQFRQWLCEPDTLKVSHDDLGHRGAAPQMRTHVAIDPDKFTARDAQLFQTRGLEFTHGKPEQLRGAKRLALAISVKDDAEIGEIQSGLAPLGGEGRLAAWRKTAPNSSFPDNCLTTLQEQIAEDRACRLILLTPAYFINGSSPAWLRQSQPGVEVTLCAIAAGRERVVSGWDYAPPPPHPPHGAPKPTRRLAPAGAVYFLKLKGEKAAIKTWVEKMWMQCVSDDDVHRQDGFGLAALGAWVKDGELQTMKMEDDDEKTS